MTWVATDDEVAAAQERLEVAAIQSTSLEILQILVGLLSKAQGSARILGEMHDFCGHLAGHSGLQDCSHFPK